MAGGKKDEKEKLAPIVIKRIKKGGGGHHGGAWKVAYADFVTAMMAFFLLLWLLNVTTEDQKNAISNYFDPSHPMVSDSVSGAGGIMGGQTITVDGSMVSTKQPIAQPDTPDTSTRGEMQGSTEGKDDPEYVKSASEQQLEEELRKKEDARFQQAADKLKAEIANSPELKAMANNLLIDITPEGLRIQIVDDKGRSMFPSGSAKMYDFMRQILLKVTGAIKPLPNQVSVRGHTDSNKYRDPKSYDNWNLSSDRAQASRRVMVEGGLLEARVENVMGRSDRDALDKDPASPRNRRISIILLRDRLIHKTDATKKPGLYAPSSSTSPASNTTTEQKPKPASGLTIVDDTAAQQTPASTQNGHSRTTTPDEPPITPLPTTPSSRSNISPQPRTMYFGADKDAKPVSDALYDGPTQSPFAPVNKPPTILTPAFDLPSNHKVFETDTKPVTPAAPSEAGSVSGKTESKSSATFDEIGTTPVPVMPAPIDNKPNNSKSLTFP